MTAGLHRHRISDIATQSGLSRATVDRVLHTREGVRPETVAQVECAIAELDRQRSQIQLSRKPVIFDLVIQSSSRFAHASQAILEAELRLLKPGNLRARTHLSEQNEAASSIEHLNRIAKHGSAGVILKAPDEPAVHEAVQRLAAAKIPTVTFVTDLPTSNRIAFVGLDNRSAGATAAYLVSGWSACATPVLVVLSKPYMLGQKERTSGFRETLASLSPKREVVEFMDTEGRDDAAQVKVAEILKARPELQSVYCPGGQYIGPLTAFERIGRKPVAFVSHELDDYSRQSLRTRRLSAVLHYDLHADLRRACRMLLQAKGILPGTPQTVLSQVQVVTPFNIPPTFVAGHD
ncbi:LacI family DNA-binding transcriptional regulator [Caballeronia sp. J97]|uniref:LacI family DNA-binding transcriptional regulator n=1 Tax=Caballeronia sp. J97 TaxID=2805429 RepID=UPI002AB26754|nr:LacI family DNA-binding transcriptional regulator [Caballeronia sp. J97]